MNKTSHFLSIGVKNRFYTANTYRLEKHNHDLLVIDDVELLNLENRTFHTGFFMIGLCKRGHVTFTLNGQRHRLSQGELLINFGASRLSGVEKSDDFKAIAFIESHEFVQETMMSMMHLWPYLMYIVEHPVIALDETERWRFEMNTKLIINRLKSNHGLKREATIANLHMCYLDVCDTLKRIVPRQEGTPARMYSNFDQFLRLMAQEYVQHRDVQWYAEKMGLTPKYLSEIVKQVSGRTAGQWITSFVITEIKSLLHESDLSIKEIAVEMNFPNQSFLGKYFKNIVGMSPIEYRNSQ